MDAVYYYMRSLAASNPFLTARESLMSLFDDVRKKVGPVVSVSRKLLVYHRLINQGQELIVDLKL